MTNVLPFALRFTLYALGFTLYALGFLRFALFNVSSESELATCAFGHLIKL